MPPQLPRVANGLHRLPRLSPRPQSPSICLFCSYSPVSRRRPISRIAPHHKPQSRSHLSTEAIQTSAHLPSSPNPRLELQECLRDLQKHAGQYVNLSRLQLALRGLQQTPGDESIRIAILGLADGGSSLKKAKELLRLLLADPLKQEEEWERILLEQQGGKPLLLRVGHDKQEIGSGGRLVQELLVSSPGVNGHKLEILVQEMDLPTGEGRESFAEGVLAPSLEIPTSNTGRYTPITTPVHKSLVVGDGIMGAASLARFPVVVDREIIGTAANIEVSSLDSSLPFQAIDTHRGIDAIKSFRKTVENALEYEQEWFASGVPDLVEWIKAGTATTDAAMKEPLRKLIMSLLERAKAALLLEETSKLNESSTEKMSSADLDALRQGLTSWAENAHTELRDQLDIAFDGRRWRKLSWWKLFWRVDDVSMIASDILSQRFLTDADKEIIFLAGRVAQAQPSQNTSHDPNWAYKPVPQPTREHNLVGGPPAPKVSDLVKPKDRQSRNDPPKPWPVHIPVTKNYLALETIPALQALAQRLVLQTLTTSSFASIFAGLIYASSLSTTLYEAGGVAALGIVLSMRRMQGKWETAMKFWEGEVREEGRKAVRGVEGAVEEELALQEDNGGVVVDEEVEKARELIESAEGALQRCS